MVPLTESSALGEGTIDNWIIDSSVHVALGLAVLVTMTAAAAWSVRLAVAGRVVDTTARWLVGAAAVVLGAQVLVGIKLLDQGQGISQLYIHYVGGLIPLGVFLLTGWWPRPDTAGRTRIFAALVVVGWLSALMAFTIGRAYVDR